MLAAYKVVRNDLLIALHLTLDLMRICLVLRMMLRDRTEGTHHHRIGGVGNELVAQMNTLPHDFSAGGILAIIEYYSQIFDKLAKVWSPNYKAQSGPLLAWVKRVRDYISYKDNLTLTEIRS